MDLKHTTTTTTTTIDSPDTDGETPLHSQLIKPFSSFPNGKNHHNHNHHHQQPPPTPLVITYKECLKNHAATIGSHALDGCGEFMPPLTTTPREPASLKCAACGCHRNFHRREHVNDVYGYPLLAFSAADQTQMVAVPGTPAEIKIENSSGRKRFRTKFSQEQKEKMYLFAEKVGWKMQRCDEKAVADFCNEVGIKRGIFKVWMHNNKNTFGKKDKETTSPTAITSVGATDAKRMDIYNDSRVVSRLDHEEDGNVNGGDNTSESSDQEIQENGGGGGGCGGDVHRHASNNGNNGSSSSC